LYHFLSFCLYLFLPSLFFLFIFYLCLFLSVSEYPPPPPVVTLHSLDHKSCPQALIFKHAAKGKP
jgi:Na+/H+ antiporter NhaD/arsenite permease-like protein